ncbi:hypothetical protein [Haematobacter missouriensis]|nr:hypothetical protein [Haematobacter missouriensis]
MTNRHRLTGGAIEAPFTGERLGISGGDLWVLRGKPAVAAGTRVAAGDLLFEDRKRPWIRFMSPVAGVVSRLETGPRRGLSEIEITPDGIASRNFPLRGPLNRAVLTELMVEAGLWTALRTRPFGRVPDPSIPPDAIFVTLTDGHPGAPDPAVVLPNLAHWLQRGLTALPLLTDGPIHLCHPPGLTVPEVPGIRSHGRPPGLPSAQIHALHPVSEAGMVWHLPWQEVVALGHLLEERTIWPQRILALSGAAMARPGLVLAPIGARLHDIVAGRLKDVPLRLLAGGAHGQAARFLRPGIYQITALQHQEAPRLYRAGWLSRLVTPQSAALIPNPWDEAAAPPGILSVPLMRALASGDVMAARDLGALGLIEEDLAAISHRLRGDVDYPALLRSTLDALEALQ